MKSRVASRKREGNSRFPDVYYLGGWAEKIEFMLDGGESVSDPGSWEPSCDDWMVFRPDEFAVDAMLRLSVKYPVLISRIQEYLDHTNKMFEGINEDAQGAYTESLNNLLRVIRTSVETIENDQSAGEPSPSKRTSHISNWSLSQDEILEITGITERTLRRLREELSMSRNPRGKGGVQFSYSDCLELAEAMQQPERKKPTREGGKILYDHLPKRT